VRIDTPDHTTHSGGGQSDSRDSLFAPGDEGPEPMTRKVTVATTQIPCTWDLEANLVSRIGGLTLLHAMANVRIASAGAGRRVHGQHPALHPRPQAKAEKLVRDAAAAGANIILLQVLMDCKHDLGSMRSL
jgi:hypothetical protein